MHPVHDRLRFDSMTPLETSAGDPPAVRYTRNLDRHWWGHNAQFGGYIEALAIAAFTEAINDPAMVPLSLSIHFLRPFQDGDVHIDVTVERHGRSMANAHARMYSHGKLAGQMIASFCVRRDYSEFVLATPPAEFAESIGPDEQPAPMQMGIATHEHFDFFPRIGPIGRAVVAGGAGEVGDLVGGWIRPRFDTPIDAYLLVMLQDMWLPVAYHHWPGPTVAVSVDITTQFRATLPSDQSASDGIFITLRTAASKGGFVDEDCQLWAADGTLLAQGRQVRYVH